MGDVLFENKMKRMYHAGSFEHIVEIRKVLSKHNSSSQKFHNKC